MKVFLKIIVEIVLPVLGASYLIGVLLGTLIHETTHLLVARTLGLGGTIEIHFWGGYFIPTSETEVPSLFYTLSFVAGWATAGFLLALRYLMRRILSRSSLSRISVPIDFTLFGIAVSQILYGIFETAKHWSQFPSLHFLVLPFAAISIIIQVVIGLIMALFIIISMLRRIQELREWREMMAQSLTKNRAKDSANN